MTARGREWWTKTSLLAVVIAVAGFPASAMGADEDAPSKCSPLKSNQQERPSELVCADDIVVSASLPRGQAIAPVEPLAVLGPADIAAMGGFTVGELLGRLETTTGSPRGGSTVVLLNGTRVSGMEEVQGLPPEAIERIDVLPEDAARAYGYDGTQRVTNIVLKRRFRATTIDGSTGVSTDGGRFTASANAGYAHVAGGTRFTVNAKYDRSNALRESERSIELPSLAGEDQRQYRTLLPRTDKIVLQSTIARPVLGIASSLTAGAEINRSDSLYGLPAIPIDIPASSPFALGGSATIITRIAGADRIQRGNRTDGKFTLGLVSTAGAGDWLLSFQGNFEHGWANTAIDRGLDPEPLRSAANAGLAPYQPLSVEAAPDLPRQTTDIRWSEGQAYLSANAPIADLPTGQVTFQGKFGASNRALSLDRNDIAESPLVLSRTKALAQAFVSVPLSTAKAGALSFLGSVEFNFMAIVERYSDAGTFFTGGPGLSWQPVKNLTVYLSHLSRPTAPTVEQLGDGVRVIPSVAAFDYRTGSSVLVSQTEGGNRLLQNEYASAPGVWVFWHPFGPQGLRISTSYMSYRVRNPIVQFPVLSAELEQAFPGRFARDGQGNLIGVDVRPINLQRSQSDTIRSNITWSKAFGASPAASTAVGDEAARSPAASIRTPSRVNVGLLHTWRLRELIEIAPGLRKLDLLNGDALGRTGGQRKHEIRFQGAVARGPLSINLDFNWQSGSTVDLGTGTPGRLTFDPLGRADLSIQYDFGKAARDRKSGWLAGAMLRVDIRNITNARPTVRDGAGGTPLFYQPALLDPLGRTTSLRLRKQF